MNKHEQHLTRILNRSIPNIKKKYLAGAKEHSVNGRTLADLTPRQLITCALEEVYDLLAYLETWKIIHDNQKKGLPTKQRRDS